MNVPFIDIKAQNASIWDELSASIDPVFSGARFILGPAVEAFEQQFAEYIGVNHGVGVNNGTSALHMALIAHDIGPGDEVITTPHTWISTSWAISYVGATSVFVDIDPDTYTLDANLVEQAVTKRTKAILPVHLYGQSADIVQLRRIADDRGLTLIEDAAQAHGAEFDGKRLGSFGEAGCFSFYPGKNLGAFGEGGAVVTNDAETAARVRRLRDHAQDGRHHHVELGFNTRMEGLQGAVLGVKLRHLDRWNELRRRHAQRYLTLLADIDGLILPAVPTPEAHVWHLFVVLVDAMDRDDLQTQLSELGVAAGIHYPVPVPYQQAYAHLGYRPGDFPVAENVMARCISLPMFPEMSDSQIEFVCGTVKKCLAGVPAAVVESSNET